MSSMEDCENTSVVINFAQLQVSIVKIRHRGHKHKKNMFLYRVKHLNAHGSRLNSSAVQSPILIRSGAKSAAAA